MSQSSNVRAAFRFFRGKGLTAQQAAGIVGSMQGESGVNLDPKARNPSSGAYGIAQWLGARKNAAVTSGDLGQQLNHVWAELQGPERGALAGLKKARNTKEASFAWQKLFERGAPFEQKYDLRASNAAKVLRDLGGDTGSFQPTNSSGKGGGGTAPSVTVQPGRSVADAREAVLQAFSQPRSLKGSLKRGSRLATAAQLFASGAAQTPAAPSVDVKAGKPAKGGGSNAAVPSLGDGTFKITGADPQRLKPALVAFARKVAGVYGSPLTGDSGATHSKYTVDGNVSEHFTGNATDIPLSGAALTKAGQDALIAAGWSPKRARATKGGLFNVVTKDGRRHQIIFNTMQGGNHFTHLHISSRD